MQAANQFFEHPVLNNPYEQSKLHWELDPSDQPTKQVLPYGRSAEFITLIPKPRKRKRQGTLEMMIFDEGKGFLTAAQQYNSTSHQSIARSGRCMAGFAE